MNLCVSIRMGVHILVGLASIYIIQCPTFKKCTHFQSTCRRVIGSSQNSHVLNNWQNTCTGLYLYIVK